MEKRTDNISRIDRLRADRTLPREQLRLLFKLGTPAALQETLLNVSLVFLVAAANSLGVYESAAVGIGSKINVIFILPVCAMSVALATMVGQNIGAGKMDRVKKGFYISTVSIAIWGSLIGLMFFLFPVGISNIFFHEPEVLTISIGYLTIIALGEPFMSVEIVSSGAISGLGNTKICSILSVIFTGARIPMAYLLSHTTLGLNGLWWTLTITSIFKGIAFVLAFQKESKKRALTS